MKILILAYDFPPFISIGGLRPYSWYKYLPGFDVDTTVITRDWELDQSSGANQTEIQPKSVTERQKNKTLIKVRFTPAIKDRIAAKLQSDKVRRLRQVVTYLFSFLEFLSLRFDSKAELYVAADELLKHEKFDMIIASGKPFILFRYAALLSKKYKTPWIADYRDSWTLNHNQSDYSLGPLSFILNSFYKLVERKYVSSSSLITTVAPSMVKVMPPFVKHDNIKIVYNGYDDDIEEQVKGILPSTQKFVVSYAGHIYPMQRLEVFLEGAVKFISESMVTPEEFEMHFWGIEADPSAITRIMNYNPVLQKYVHLHNKTGYFEVMKQISISHVLLLLTSNSDSWLNAKLFDYLVLKRPVLMIGNKTNVMTEILKETNGGTVAENAESATAFLSSQFKVYKNAKPNETVNFQQYSRKNQAEKLYLILKNMK